MELSHDCEEGEQVQRSKNAKTNCPVCLVFTTPLVDPSNDDGGDGANQKCLC